MCSASVYASAGAQVSQQLLHTYHPHDRRPCLPVPSPLTKSPPWIMKSCGSMAITEWTLHEGPKTVDRSDRSLTRRNKGLHHRSLELTTFSKSAVHCDARTVSSMPAVCTALLNNSVVGAVLVANGNLSVAKQLSPIFHDSVAEMHSSHALLSLNSPVHSWRKFSAVLGTLADC